MVSNEGGWYRPHELTFRKRDLGGYSADERRWVQDVCAMMNAWAINSVGGAADRTDEFLPISL